MVMKNSPSSDGNKFSRTNVVYRYSCPNEDCKLLSNVNYIGMTTTTLSRRLTSHLTAGAPKKHMHDVHRIDLNRAMLENSTNVVMQCNDQNRLAIAEALFVLDERPAINIQNNIFARTLKLFS